jgi:hypothetical protein
LADTQNWARSVVYRLQQILTRAHNIFIQIYNISYTVYIYSLVSVIHEPAWTHHGLSWSEHGILPNLVVIHTLSLWKCPWLWVFPLFFPMFEQPPIRFIPICHPDTMRRWPPARHASDCPAPGNVWASLFTISLLGYPLFLIGLMILHNTECTEMTKKIDDFISHNSPQRTVGGMLHASNKLSKLLNIAYPVQWSWNRKRNAMDGVLRWAPIYFHTTKGPVLWRNLPSPQIIQAMDDHFRSDLKHEMDPNMVVSSLTHHGFLACV